ncbi:MAG: c-type cytochrome [Anaerolineales bacterium]
MRAALKWIGIALVAIVGIVLVAGLVMYTISGSRLNKTYDVQAESINVPSDEGSLARGEKLATGICVGCHGPNLGGQALMDDPMIGVVYAPNLTSGAGGMAATFSDADFVHAIRHGIGPDGKALMIMPADAFIHFSEEDLGSIIAYLRGAPPIDNTVPARRLTPMARVLLAAGAFGPVFPVEYINHDTPYPPMPEIGANVAYGEYLGTLCATCHGPKLSGMQPSDPESAVAPNLTLGGELAGWTEQDFITAIETGVTPGGHMLNNDYMPWQEFSDAFSEDELRGVYMYLQTLPALGFGEGS